MAVSFTQFRQIAVAWPKQLGQTVREKWFARREGEFLEAWFTQHPDGDQAASAIHYAFAKHPETWSPYGRNPVIDRSNQDQDFAVARDPATGEYLGFDEVDDNRLELFRSADGLDWTQDTSWVIASAASPVPVFHGAEIVVVYEDFTTNPFSIKLRRAPDVVGLLSAIPILVWQDAGANDAVPDSLVFGNAAWWLYSHIEDGGSGNWPAHYQTSPDLSSWTVPRRVLGSDGQPLPDAWTAPSVLIDQVRVLMFVTDQPDGGNVLLLEGDDTIVPPETMRWHLDDIPQDTAIQGTVTRETRPGGQADAAVVFDGATKVDTGMSLTWPTGFISWDHPNPDWRMVAALSDQGTWFKAPFDGADPLTWTHYAMVQDGGAGVMTAYVNKVPVWTTPTVTGISWTRACYAKGQAPGSVATGPIHQENDGVSMLFGTSSADPAKFWQGSIDDARIYRWALTPAEIAGL